METDFTPVLSLVGGVLIGVAAVLLMALRGRIFGATGLLAGAVFNGVHNDNAWRFALLLGMVSGPAAMWLITGSLPVVEVPISTPALILGGVIVGLGVTWGGGCTSGHGVCGMARFSLRSFVATGTFMVMTFLTVYVVRHVLGG